MLYSWDGHVEGVATGDFGVAKDGSRKPTYSPGVDLRARVTLLAEGCRGSLSEVGVGPVPCEFLCILCTGSW